MSESNGLHPDERLAQLTAAGRAMAEIRSRLAEVETPEDADDLRRRAAAVEFLVKLCRADLLTQNQAAGYRIDCERQLGGMFGPAPPRGRPRRGESPNGGYFGLSAAVVSRLRKLAAIPPLWVEAYKQTCDETGVELTTNGLLRQWNDENREPRDGETVREPDAPPVMDKAPEPTRAERIKSALTGVTRQFTVWINTEPDGQKFRHYMNECGLGHFFDQRDITVRLDDGTLKTFPVRFRGFTALRWVLNLAAKKGTLGPAKIRQEFEEAKKANAGDWDGDGAADNGATGDPVG